MGILSINPARCLGEAHRSAGWGAALQGHILASGTRRWQLRTREGHLHPASGPSPPVSCVGLEFPTCAVLRKQEEGACKRVVPRAGTLEGSVTHWGPFWADWKLKSDPNSIPSSWPSLEPSLYCSPADRKRCQRHKWQSHSGICKIEFDLFFHQSHHWTELDSQFSSQALLCSLLWTITRESMSPYVTVNFVSPWWACKPARVLVDHTMGVFGWVLEAWPGILYLVHQAFLSSTASWPPRSKQMIFLL